MPEQFKAKYSKEQRSAESGRILQKYPDKIPIICEKYIHDKSDFVLDKSKYLTNNDMTLGQFLYVIRKRIKMDSKQSLFMFCGDTLIPGNMLLSEAYLKHKDDDGFLYLKFSLENTFGF
tara:strand:+ start:2597 stop:2953 length:357 start_codon:yes stop_codon:yes gene_type:complete